MPHVALASGGRVGVYEILALVGEGGMGQVYRARDTRLDRVVALKVLPEAVAADAERRERFDREARAVAALNHPHICQLHDVGDAGDTRFLVMEYLEGETLQARLLRGPLPIAELLRHATALADALDHAHRRGLVHRDVKPANIMLTASGVKLLDFGLSRLQPKTDLPALETMTHDRAPLTAGGAVLGTYPYMSPEQLTGKEADARADVFACGAVLYEMATGERAFAGTTAATVIGAILHTDPPPVSTRQSLAPAALDRIVARCLAKEPDNRWQTARDLLLELQWLAEKPPSATGLRGSQPPRRLHWSAVLAGLALVAVGVPAAIYLNAEPVPEPAVELSLNFSGGVTPADVIVGGRVAISPDGRLLAFAALNRENRQRLWLRSIGSNVASELPGTDGAAFPFWSPDSRSIGFFAQRSLKRVSATGGAVQTLAEAIQPRGGTWGSNGVILFAAELGFEMYQVSEAGGNVSAVPADGLNRERAWPSFLPDGRHYVYFGRPQAHGIYLGDLDSPGGKLLLRNDVGVAFVPPDHLLVLSVSSKSAREGSLMAQAIDLQTLELKGEAVPIAQGVAYVTVGGIGAFSASHTGRIVYTSIPRPPTQLTWFDRSGREVGILDGPSSPYAPSISPDERTVAVSRIDPDTISPDLYLVDVARGVSPRLTFNPREDFLAVWSPDGSTIVHAAQPPGGPPNLFRRAIGVEGGEEHLFKSAYNTQPTDWWGQYVIYARRDPRSEWDLYYLSMSPGADRVETKFLASPRANEHQAQFSPDGNWVAYVSDESGVNEVYVQSFPKLGTRVQISTDGGTQPRWRADGRELFYFATDGRLMSVNVTVNARLEPGKPIALFRPRAGNPSWTGDNFYYWNYDVTRDGSRFLITTVPDPDPPVTTVVLNWLARLPAP